MDVRVGVFVSNCNEQLSDTLDLPSLQAYVNTIPGVAYVAENNEYVLHEGIQLIREAVDKHRLNRVVVSAGDAITAMIRIRRVLEEHGVNPYCVEVINLREHCARPHRTDPQGATEKAKAMLLAAIEKIKLQLPVETLEFPVKQSTLVIGGGLAGIQTAIDLTDLGFQVHLVEREATLGGLAAKAGRFFPTDDCSLCISSPSCDLKGITHTSRKCLYRSGFSELPNLQIYTSSQVVSVEGVPGNYHVVVEQGQGKTGSIVDYYPPIYSLDEGVPVVAEGIDTITLDVGAIIVATGFEEFDVSHIKEYNYGAYPDVVTQLELAAMLDPFGPTGGALTRPSNKRDLSSIVMIQCVGSRDQRYKAYCSSICCMIALKHSLMIKERFPEVEVKICYIDMRSWGREHEENYYEKARQMGVKFVKGRPTEVMRDPVSTRLIVDVEDALLGEFLGLDADLVVLSTAFVPSKGTPHLAEELGLELGEDGFIKEYNSKLRPSETKLRGVYLSGGVTFPKDAPITSLHSSSAAIKAAKFMNTGKYVKDALTAVIDSDLCGDCEFCPVLCPYEAINLVEEGDHTVAQVEDARCEACGICVGTCPKNAIVSPRLSEEQIMAQVSALVQHNSKGSTVMAFSCAECGFTAVDTAGMAPVEYPSTVRILKVPCTGILKVHHFLEAFNQGADAVMVVACKTNGCHYEDGSVIAKRRVELTKRLLDQLGIGSERLEMFHNVSIEGKDFVQEAKRMVDHARTLGPLQ